MSPDAPTADFDLLALRLPPATPAQRPHILTVALEDYFQVGAFNRFVQRNQWYRFEPRLEQSTAKLLELLAAHDARATVFVLGWVARRFPHLVRRVADAGHEVAVKGYYHRGIGDMTPEEFARDCVRARDAVEQATGRETVGYRLADGWLAPGDLWALDVLAGLGFAYDSSVAPIGGVFAGQPLRRHPHKHEAGGRTLWEVPVSTARVPWPVGPRVPVAGGNYLRQLPRWLTRRAAARWAATEPAPLVAYFHAWELDHGQPRLAIGSVFTQKRHYRNLKSMPARLAELLSAHKFTSVADYLKLSVGPAPARPSSPTAAAGDQETLPPGTVFGEPESSPSAAQPAAGAKAVPLTVVVPLFNEEESVQFLSNTLAHVRTTLAPRYDVRFVLVDDGSTDDTWPRAEALFAGKPGFTLARHERNFGVAAAIMTGIRRAETEVVASMDCDCSYDPLELRHMVPLLAAGVDVVTASPYHPAGAVRNVPAWRLTLSKGAAWMYRRVLRTKLATYTSCFRVYRRSSVAAVSLTHDRYLGVAEMLGLIDLTGGTIVEYPTTLEVRVFGRSKMKTARTVVGHLGLMARLARARLLGTIVPPHRDAVIKDVIGAHHAHNAVLIRQHPPAPPPRDPDDVRRAVVNPPRQPEATAART
jgi:polysaccharide deacetylase family protein (PEP-CTERM system associated)